MAVIAMFYGIIISMYYFDNRKHHVPHIHIKYQDQEATVSIPDGEVLEGKIKPIQDRSTEIGVISMNPRIKDVKPNSNYTLTLTFTNDEVKVFDVKPYLDKGIFKELKDANLFNSVKPFLGSIQWKNGQDLCPDTLYLESKKA